MNKRTVDISNYWITIVRDTAQFGQIAVAENPEFNMLAECIFNALEDTFIQSASEYGVKRWESMLQIAPSASDTLDERKARILTYLNLKLPYTWRVLKQLIEGVVGEGNVDMNLDNDTQTLHMNFNETVDSSISDDIDDLISRVVPMNLEVKCDYYLQPAGYTPLEYLESSGTQVIKTGHIPTTKTGFRCKVQEIRDIVSGQGVWLCGCQTSTNGMWLTARKDKSYKLAVQVGNGGSNAVIVEDNATDKNIVECELNFYNSKMAGKVGNLQKINMDGNWTAPFALFKATFKQEDSYDPTAPLRIYYFALTEGDKLIREYIPVLDPKGVPCLFDCVSRTPFYNSGTGTFGYALRENTMRASGVYARMVNGEIEVLADTEDPTSAVMTTDLDDDVTAFVHFNNVGEAMEYYNIEPEKLTEEGVEQ